MLDCLWNLNGVRGKADTEYNYLTIHLAILLCMQKPHASLAIAKDLFEVLQRTTRESPGKSHDDVTKIVWVPYQAPPTRNQESSTR